MLKKLSKWELGGLITVLIAGSLLHFVYGWLNQNALVGAFSPVNESTWEHLKLLFYPMLLYSIVEYALAGREAEGFWWAKASGLLAGLAAIVVLFYTYTGIIGRNFLWADILTFVLGAAIAYWVGWRQLQRGRHADFRQEGVALAVLFLLLLCFILFTYFPPAIGLFQDPVTGGYGMVTAM